MHAPCSALSGERSDRKQPRLPPSSSLARQGPFNRTNDFLDGCAGVCRQIARNGRPTLIRIRQNRDLRICQIAYRKLITNILPIRSRIVNSAIRVGSPCVEVSERDCPALTGGPIEGSRDLHFIDMANGFIWKT